ncbi:hypothetical protein Tco_0333610 [Tanacetum coccineum]
MYKSSKLRLSIPGLFLMIKETCNQAEGKDKKDKKKQKQSKTNKEMESKDKSEEIERQSKAGSARYSKKESQNKSQGPILTCSQSSKAYLEV